MSVPPDGYRQPDLRLAVHGMLMAVATHHLEVGGCRHRGLQVETSCLQLLPDPAQSGEIFDVQGPGNVASPP